MRDYDIESDLKQEKFQSIKLVQGDRGNKIKINIYEDGQPVSLIDCSISAKYKRADGEVVNDGIIENINDNYFYAVMDSDITKASGTLKMIFTIEKDDVKVSTFLLLADVREGIGENTGSSGGSTGGGSGEVTIDLSNYYKKIETYSKNQIDARFKDIAINVKDFGALGDGCLIDSSLTINDISYPIKKYNGTDNTIILQKVADSTKNIYIPEGIFYVKNGLILKNKGTKLFGAGKGKTIIVVDNQGVVVKESDIEIKELSIIGVYDKFKPPISLDSSNNQKYYNFGYSCSGITMASDDGCTKDNLMIQNVSFSMVKEAFNMTCDQVNLNSNKYTKNVRMINCDTDYIWWHGFATRYVDGAIVEGCNFNNHWVGMMANFSTGTKNSIMSGCIGNNISYIFKNESKTGAENKNCLIVNNIINSCLSTENNNKEYLCKTTGNGCTISNNRIVCKDSIPRIFYAFAKDTVINGNTIIIEGAINNIIEVGMQNEVNGDLIFNDNIVINKSESTPNFLTLLQNYSLTSEHIIVKNNNFVGFYDRLVRLTSPILNTINSIDIINNNCSTFKMLYEMLNNISISKINILNNKITLEDCVIMISGAKIGEIQEFNIINNNCTVSEDITLRRGFLFDKGCVINKLNISDNFIKNINKYCFYSNNETNSIDYMVFKNNTFIMNGSESNNHSFYFKYINNGHFINNLIQSSLLIDSATSTNMNIKVELFNKIYATNNIYDGLHTEVENKIS